jgi:NAD(P)-dependent dehydrogenase (short-subunit alcohol dehydrogenase family)
MQPLQGKVALVTGASRGVGKGIAMSLGEAGATVYVTGRTLDEKQAAVPLAGTVTQTAEEVTRLGGRGIAIRCDHHDDAQVEAAFRQIQAEQGRLDILVNNAWAGYEGYATGSHYPPNFPFWQKPISYWDENLAGVRWTYVSTVFAAPMMVEQRGGLIVNISFGVPEPGNPAYGVAKSATDRLSWEFAHQLREYNVAALSLYPGLVRTEGVLLNAQYFDMSKSESPQFTGRAVAALAPDPDVIQRSGQVFVVAKLAQEYGFDDIDGTRPAPV